MTRGERGQVTVAAVGIAVAVMLGMVVLLHLAAIRSGGARGQTAADVAALAGVRVLASNPDASAASVRAAVDRAASQNGARVERFKIESVARRPTAVDVTVSELVSGAVPGVGRRADRVRSWSRAGVTYTATLAPASFRPIDLAGAHGASAVVAAAEAQVGWPYVWGGESRAEGGFDCSGLVDYAYGAAGIALPGRPTAADLWHMSRHISEAELAPGDLMFLGTDTGEPYHVGMYVGGGLTVVAPHTGAQVSYERLIDNPWDGFGRLLSGPPAEDPVASGTEAAARKYDVPPDVVSAELTLGLDTNPYRVAMVLQETMERDHSDLMRALTDQLKGDASTAALVMRTAAGPALGAGFQATIKLLPRPQPPTDSSPVPLRGGGSAWGSLISTGSSAVNHVGDWIHGRGGRLPEHLGHGANLGLDALSVLPNRTLSAFAQVVSAGWDVARVARAFASEAPPAAGGLLGAGVWLVQVLIAGFGLYRARTWRGRLYNGAMLAGGVLGLAAVGAAAGLLGTALVAASPFLLAAAIVITAGATIYANWDTLTSASSRATWWCVHKASSTVHSVASFIGL